MNFIEDTIENNGKFMVKLYHKLEMEYPKIIMLKRSR